MAAGIRVVRGPDWNLGDQDGGEGHVGTVVKEVSGGKVHVVWDGGETSTCRAGNGGHDLRVLDNATVGVSHPPVVCDECQQSGIMGMRWKCAECDNFDLCSLCYFSDCHSCGHQFLRYETPDSHPEKMERRSRSMKMRVLGIFPGATVMRGEDWEWEDQDGGKGNIGQVEEVFEAEPLSARSVVQVQWENGSRNIYRVGYKGKVDLKYSEEAPGVECYPHHLPSFELSQYIKAKPNDTHSTDSIAEGDTVCISVGKEQLEQLQKSHSGWVVGMTECIGKVGKVQGFAPNGDAIIVFGTKKYRLFPGALKKCLQVSEMSIGDRVRIISDEDEVRQLQDGHGGYNPQMRTALGKVGEVVKVDKDGDFVVRFDGHRWVFNPACCIPAPGENIDSISIIPVADDSDSSESFLSQGDNLLKLFAALGQAIQDPTVHIFFKTIADGEETSALRMLKDNPTLVTARTQGLTALHISANKGLLTLTQALVAAGANINERDRDGDTPLTDGMANIEVAEFLINKGCDIKAANNKGQTASHKAAIRGYSALLKQMLSRGADFNAQDNEGDTPLHDAISQGETSAAEVIISWPKLDIRCRNKKGFSPLQQAALRGEHVIAELLLRRDKTTVDEEKDDGFTPLHVCAVNDHHEVIRVLVEKGGAQVNKKGKKGETPLHIACTHGYLNSVRLLVEKGADVNSRDNMGNTPLHLAVAADPSEEKELHMLLMLLGRSRGIKEDHCLEVVCVLLQNGADTAARNYAGLKPLDLCRNEKVKNAVERFIADGSTTEVTQASSGTRPSSEPDKCGKCKNREAEILLVPCGHHAVCRSCCNNLRLCPRCGSSVKSMFDRNGKQVNDGCFIM